MYRCGQRIADKLLGSDVKHTQSAPSRAVQVFVIYLALTRFVWFAGAVNIGVPTHKMLRHHALRAQSPKVHFVVSPSHLVLGHFQRAGGISDPGPYTGLLFPLS